MERTARVIEPQQDVQRRGRGRANWLVVIPGVIAAVLLLALVVFIALPSPIDAIAWSPSPAPAAEGVLAPNDLLRDAQLLGVDEFSRPEDVTFDVQGRMYSAMGMENGTDGRIIRVTFAEDGTPSYETFANTEGNPLDLRFAPDGNLIVADWVNGIVSIDLEGVVTTVVPIDTVIEGAPFRRPDGVAIGSDGMIYYSEGSRRDGVYNAFHEVIEARSWGRLLAYDPATQISRVLIPELYFGNGVVLAPDESFVLVADQYRYRIARYWLSGAQAGTWDYLVENLPGFPHNIHFDESGLLWVALNSGRVALLDNLHPTPFLKNQLAKLPQAWFLNPHPPETARGVGSVIALDAQGEIVTSLQNPPASLNTLSAAYPFAGSLYIVSLDGSGFLRYRYDN